MFAIRIYEYIRRVCRWEGMLYQLVPGTFYIWLVPTTRYFSVCCCSVYLVTYKIPGTPYVVLIYQKLFGSHSNPDRGLAVIRTSLCDSTRSPRQHRALFVRCSLYITRWNILQPVRGALSTCGAACCLLLSSSYQVRIHSSARVCVTYGRMHVRMS